MFLYKNKKSFYDELNLILKNMSIHYEAMKVFNHQESEYVQKLNLLIGFAFLNDSVLISSINDQEIHFLMKKENEEPSIYIINKYEFVHKNLKKFCEIFRLNFYVNFNKDLDQIIDRVIYLVLSPNIKEVLDKELRTLSMENLRKIWGCK